MKVLIVLALVAAGQCALLGSRKCTYGPSYWCSHLHHAKECSAVKHCLDTVWSRQTPNLIGATETCLDVIAAINTVRSAGEGELLTRMAMACTTLTGEHRDQCKELLKDDQDEVFLLLQSKLPSSAVASALGFCGSFSDRVPRPSETKKIEVTGDYCKDCVNFFGDVRQIFNNSEGQVVNELKSLVCPQLGSLADLCNQLMDQYATMVMNVLFQQLNPNDICFFMQFCKNQSSADINLKDMFRGYMAKVHASNVSCILCRDGAKTIQDSIRDAKLQKELQSNIENVLCPLMPGKLGAECKMYVQAYAPLVFQVIVAEFDPESFCDMLGLCASKEAAVPGLVHLSLGSHATNVKLAPSQSQSPAVGGGPQCALCEFAMTKLEDMLKDNKTQEAIKSALDQLCSFLPSTLSTECQQFVDTYEKTIIILLTNELSPDEICSALGLCTAQEVKKLEASPLKDSEMCSVCELGIQELESFIKNDEKVLEGDLDKVCDLLSNAQYQDMCRMLVQQYGPQLLDMLINDLDPTTVCTTLGLCTKNEENKTKFPAGRPLMFRPMADIKPARMHMLGRHECTFGPDYWCASKKNAALCNVTADHCKQLGKTLE